MWHVDVGAVKRDDTLSEARCILTGVARGHRSANGVPRPQAGGRRGPAKEGMRMRSARLADAAQVRSCLRLRLLPAAAAARPTFHLATEQPADPSRTHNTANATRRPTPFENEK